MMSKYTAAYLAGLIDGEGYIGIWQVSRGNKKTWKHTHETYYHPVVKVVMTDESIIRWLKDSFGGVYELRKFSQKDRNWKDSHGWMLRKAQVVEFLQHIRPYLRVKKQQADLVLAFSKIKAKPLIPTPDDIHEKKRQMYMEMRQLNKRGAA